MSRASSAIECLTHVRLIRRSSAGSNGRASRLRIDGRSATSRPSAAASDLIDRLQGAVDLLRGVVVDEPESQDSTGFGLAQALHQAGRIEIAVPGVDAIAGEGLRGCARGNAGERNR